MKYHCEHCGGIIEPGDGTGIYKGEMPFDGTDYEAKECLFCGALNVYKIPDYETPEQYETRTGESFPNNGLVWVSLEAHKGFLVEAYKRVKSSTKPYFYGGHYWKIANVVIADPPIPPNDWRPQ